MRSRTAVTVPGSPPPPDAIEREYQERGERAPWECVWNDGRDVTDDDPTTWPWPFSEYYARGWRPVEVEATVGGMQSPYLGRLGVIIDAAVSLFASIVIPWICTLP